MLYPLLFKPIFQERIWGGRNLESLYGKKLPANARIGESWEICDRPEAQSVVANGPLAGKTLHWLMEHHQQELLGEAKSLHGRFPLLIKILDAEEKLSLQVHPPPGKASLLEGEPKTEIWYITRAQAGAELYVGLKTGATRHEFERKIKDGSVADCFHRVKVKSGDTMFLPSGRVHAIGAGLVIFEIQQNSDTTYRVFDWSRTDSAGKARALHVRESLECIDFDDFEPKPIRPELENTAGTNLHIQTLVEDPLFSMEVVTTISTAHIQYALRSALIVAVVEGSVLVPHLTHQMDLRPGDFCLLPAALGSVKLESPGPSKFLVVKPGKNPGA